MRTKSAALSAVLALVLFLSACKSGDASQNAARSLEQRLLSGAAWEPIKTGLPAIEEGSAVYLTGEKVMFVTPENVCTAYEWNSEAEGFEPAGTPEGGTIAEGTGACVFPGGPSTVA